MRIRLTVLWAMELYVLLRCWPDWAGIATHLRSSRSWVDMAGADRVILAIALALAWLLAMWLGIGLLAITVAVMPAGGGAGRARAHRLAAVLLPARLRRFLLAVLGISMALGASPAVAAPPGGPPGIVPTTVTVTAPGWPGQAQTPGGSTPPADTLHSPRSVTVRPGDSLWKIAAESLPSGTGDARIAGEWPAWYATNRDRIGDDPNLLRPGQRLTAPGDGAEGEH